MKKILAAGLQKLLHSSLVVAALVMLLAAPLVSADGLNVGASIPYDPPTQPAVFDPGIDSMTVHDALFTLSGTCQLMNPQSAVSIWRGGVSIGSAACTGSFQLQVMLKSGANDLTARTANASTLYGPDSTSVTVTLILPDPTPPPSSTGSSNIEPSTPEQLEVATNAAVASGLDITPSQAFSVLNSSNTITISVLVGGGDHPYDIVINWGDGSVDTHHVDAPGSYSFDHQYQAPGAYKVHGHVHDVLGAYSEFDYSVLSGQKYSGGTTTTKSTTTGQKPSDKKTTWRQYLKPGAVAAGGIVVVGGTYWMGLRRATSVLTRRYEAQQAARALRAKNRANRKFAKKAKTKDAKSSGRRS